MSVADTRLLPDIVYPDLAGKRFLVTGTSQGIGQAVAQALLNQGAQVLGVANEVSDFSGDYQHFICDLSDAQALEACMREVCADALDGVVNIAGIDPKIPLSAAGLAAWERVIDLDLRAYHLIIHHALDALKSGTMKSIVNMASINHQLGVPERGLYTIAKCGIVGLTRGLARELGRGGIRINTISPGWVLTERQRQEYFPDSEEGRLRLEDLFTQKQSLALEIQPEDIAAHVLFYLSGISRASTGHNCVVDAGWILQ